MSRAGVWLSLVQRIWVITFVVTAVVLGVAYLDRIHGALAQRIALDGAWLAAAGAAQATVWLLLCGGWRAVVRASTAEQISWRESAVHFGIFAVGKYLPGKLWGALARGARLRGTAAGTSGAVHATVLEQVLVFQSALILAAAAAATVVATPLRWALASLCVAALAAGPSGARACAHAIAWGRRRFAGTTGAEWNGNVPSALDYFRLLAQYGLAWVAHGVVLALLAAAVLGYERTGALLGLFLLANAASMVVGFVAVFAPAGIGVRDVTLAAILGLGLPVADAAILAAVSRMFSVAADLVAGVLAAWCGAPVSHAVDRSTK